MANKRILNKSMTAFQPMIDQAVAKKKNDATDGSLALTANQIIFNKPTLNSDRSVNKQSFFNVSFEQLRSFSVSYPIARACINHRMAQITQLSWTVSPVKVLVDSKEKEAVQKRCEEVTHKLKFPTGTREMTFRSFLMKIIDDILTIDAISIERRKTYGKKVAAWAPFDAATIELLLMPDGTTPQPPLPAYQQKIQGKVTAKLTTEDIYYGMMHPRTYSPYGLSPLETLVMIVTTALKLQSYNLGYLSEGNVPEGFVELPKEIASNPDQLMQWQEAWDAIFSGDPRYQRKLKFLPEGMKYWPTKKNEDMTFERFEKWLLLNTCAVYKVSPQEIGFTENVNKASAAEQTASSQSVGMMPLAHFIKEIMDGIIQEDMGETELEFTWLNLNPTDKLEEAKIADTMIRNGSLSSDEWRLKEGYEPIGLAHYIMTPIGPIFVRDLIAQSEQGMLPTLPYALPADQQNKPAPEQPSNAKAPGAAKEPRKDTTNPETMRNQTRAASGAQANPDQPAKDKKFAAVEELKKWKKAAKNDLKMGKSYRDFYSSILDERTKGLVRMGLQKAASKESIDQVFEPFLEETPAEVQELKDLYARIADIIKT